MAEGFLEPVVTKLEGDISNLDRKLTEALALMKAFGEKSKTQQKTSGEQAGKSGGEALMTAYRKALEDGQKNLPKFGDVLENEIKRGQQQVHNLATELRKTGDIDVFKKLRTAEKDLKDLEQFGKDIAQNIGKGLEQGEGTIVSGIQGLLKNAVTGAPLITALVGAILVASPLIGATLGGALLAGVAGAGIGVAVAGQLSSPVVKTAWANLKAEGEGVVKAVTAPLEPVFVKALNGVNDLLGRSVEPLQKAYEDLAPHVDALVNGFMNMVREAAPAFLQFLHQAGPVLDQVGAGLGVLGHDLAVMFKEIGSESAGAGQGLHDFIHLVGWAAEATGALIGTLSRGYEIFSGLADLFSGNFGMGMSKIRGDFQQADTDVGKLSSSTKDLTDAYKRQTDAIDKLNKAYDDMINKNMTSDEAAIKQKQSVQDLTVAIAENGRWWDINTEAGRKNNEALLASIDSSAKKRDADIANGKDAVQAAMDYNQEVEALLEIARKAGLSKDALDKLRGKYEVDVQEYYTTHFINEGTPPQDFHHGLAEGGGVFPGGRILHAAEGLLPPRSPGTLVLAGEARTGGEWMIPRRGITQQRAAELVGAAAADHGLSVGGGDGATLQVKIPVYLNGQQVAEASYEDFVNFGQERKNRRGSTGF